MRALLVSLLAVVACTRRSEPPAPPQASAAKPAVSSLASPPGAPVTRHGIAWYEDAPDAAFAEAKRQGKPVLVDLWAGWCHTCLSMQRFVLTDTKLPGAHERFVFLAIDTDREKNASFLARFPVSVWPTFYVIDPRGSSVRGRWLGAATPAEFSRFLEDGRAAVELEQAPRSDDSLRAAREADQAATERDHPRAAAKYAEALARAPKDSPRRPAWLVARAAALGKARAFDDCVGLGLASMDETGSGVSAVDFAVQTTICASEVAKSAPSEAMNLRRKAERRFASFCEGPAAELAPDDRADACGNLEAVRRELGDSAGARRAAERGLEIVTDASQGMPDDVQLTYDRARSDFLLSLDRADEALKLLEQRKLALPDNYNPYHLIARVERHRKRWDEGLRAIDRALSLAYGPRRVNLMSLKVELLLGAKRKEDAIRVLTEQIAAYEALPEGQKLGDARAKASRRLEELRPPAEPK